MQGWWIAVRLLLVLLLACCNQPPAPRPTSPQPHPGCQPQANHPPRQGTERHRHSRAPLHPGGACRCQVRVDSAGCDGQQRQRRLRRR